jgi:glutaredoxin 3
MRNSAFILLLFACKTVAFIPGISNAGARSHMPAVGMVAEDANAEDISEEIIKGLGNAAETTKKALTRGFSSFSDGGDFKQAVADVLAGDFDREVVKRQVEADVASADVVIFGWGASPACKKARKLLEGIDAAYTWVPLDDPWDEGNKKRAEIGRMVGRSSVPAVFVKSKYIGGCDDGPSEEAPGLIPLAFQGKLRSLLIKAGALEKDFQIDL